MGGVWSYSVEEEQEPSHMRLASREVCDDETWANTVLNRSASSVQERLFELETGVEGWGEIPGESSGSESDDEIPRRRSRRSIEFAEMDMVREFVVEEVVVVDDPPQQEEVRAEFQSSLFIDFDPW